MSLSASREIAPSPDCSVLRTLCSFTYYLCWLHCASVWLCNFLPTVVHATTRWFAPLHQQRFDLTIEAVPNLVGVRIAAVCPSRGVCY